MANFENSVNVDEDIEQAIKKALEWMIDRDPQKVVDLIKNRTKLSYSSEIILLKLKEFKEDL